MSRQPAEHEWGQRLAGRFRGWLAVHGHPHAGMRPNAVVAAEANACLKSEAVVCVPADDDDAIELQGVSEEAIEGAHRPLLRCLRGHRLPHLAPGEVLYVSGDLGFPYRQRIEWASAPSDASQASGSTVSTTQPGQTGNNARGLLDIVQILATLVVMLGALYPLGMLVLYHKLVLLRHLSDAPAWYAAAIAPRAPVFLLGVDYALEPVALALLFSLGVSLSLMLIGTGVYEWFLHPNRSNIRAAGSWVDEGFYALDDVLRSKTWRYSWAVISALTLVVVITALRYFDGPLNYPAASIDLPAALTGAACIVNIALCLVLMIPGWLPYDPLRPRPEHPPFNHYFKRVHVGLVLGIAYFNVSLLLQAGFMAASSKGAGLQGLGTGWGAFWGHPGLPPSVTLIGLAIVNLMLIFAVRGKKHHLNRFYGGVWVASTAAIGCAGFYEVVARGLFHLHVPPGYAWTLYVAGGAAGIGCWLIFRMIMRNAFSVTTVLGAVLLSYFPAFLPAYWGQGPFFGPPYVPFPKVAICSFQGKLLEGEYIGTDGNEIKLLIKGKLPDGSAGNVIYGVRQDDVKENTMWGRGDDLKAVERLCERPQQGTISFSR